MKKITLIACSIVALGSNLTAASFNCNNATTPIEHAICEDQWLSEKDGEMGRWFHKAMRHANIKHEQRDWISYRNRNCADDDYQTQKPLD